MPDSIVGFNALISMITRAQDDSFVSRRAIVLVVTIVFHVLLAYGLARGLARRAIEIIAPPIQTSIVAEVQQHEVPPLPPPPQFKKPAVDVPPPDINIETPVEPSTMAITQVANTAQMKAPPPPFKAAATPPSTGKNFPNSADYYPPASMRLGEEGVVVVHACVGPNGRLAEEPTLAKTSGSSRLDDGGLKLARAGHYTPGTEDGKANTSCFNFGVKFRLRN
jgi:protein TonB